MEMWFSEFHTKDVKHSLRVTRHLYAQKSDYQQIDIFETPEFGRVLVLDGNVMLTERDEFIYDEMITHVPMAVHPGVRDILVIGAGDGGVVRELTRYDASIWWRWILRWWRHAGSFCRGMPAGWMIGGCTFILKMHFDLFGTGRLPTI